MLQVIHRTRLWNTRGGDGTGNSEVWFWWWIYLEWRMHFRLIWWVFPWNRHCRMGWRVCMPWVFWMRRLSCELTRLGKEMWVESLWCFHLSSLFVRSFNLIFMYWFVNITIHRFIFQQFIEYLEYLWPAWTWNIEKTHRWWHQNLIGDTLTIAAALQLHNLFHQPHTVPHTPRGRHNCMMMPWQTY